MVNLSSTVLFKVEDVQTVSRFFETTKKKRKNKKTNLYLVYPTSAAFFSKNSKFYVFFIYSILCRGVRSESFSIKVTFCQRPVMIEKLFTNKMEQRKNRDLVGISFHFNELRIEQTKNIIIIQN